MSTWKTGAIIALLLMLLGYGWYQTLPPGTGVVIPGMPTPTPAPDKIKTWEGKPPVPWTIPAPLWLNVKKPITPADLKGKVTLIEFFRIGCSHCQDAAPHMQSLFRELGPKGLNIIAFQSPGTSPEENDWVNVKTTIVEGPQWKMTYPIAFDPKGAVFKKYQADNFPTMLVVDAQGIIRFAQSGFDAKKELNLRQQIEHMLGLTPSQDLRNIQPGAHSMDDGHGHGAPPGAPGMPGGPGGPGMPGGPGGPGGPPPGAVGAAGQPPLPPPGIDGRQPIPPPGGAPGAAQPPAPAGAPPAGAGAPSGGAPPAAPSARP